MLPSNLKNINFVWLYYINISYDLIKYYIEVINNISDHYHMTLFLNKNIFGITGPKWPIHVVDYEESDWSPEIYEILDKYIHPYYNSVIVLINKNTYQPYSSAKSANK